MISVPNIKKNPRNRITQEKLFSFFIFLVARLGISKTLFFYSSSTRLSSLQARFRFQTFKKKSKKQDNTKKTFFLNISGRSVGYFKDFFLVRFLHQTWQSRHDFGSKLYKNSEKQNNTRKTFFIFLKYFCLRDRLFQTYFSVQFFHITRNNFDSTCLLFFPLEQFTFFTVIVCRMTRFGKLQSLLKQA